LRFVGLNGNEYELPLARYKKMNMNDSKYHSIARAYLREYFPHDMLLEELPILECPSKLNLDFFVPAIRLGVEVQGQQHYQFNTFFYKNKRDFALAKRRDEYKVEWAELNGIRLVCLKWSETEKWGDKILGKTEEE
jgi:hypothetical protein